MSATVTRRPRFGLEFARSGAPHPGPPAGAPLRVSFVGQSTFFEATALDERSARIDTRFIEFRAGRDPDELRAAATVARSGTWGCESSVQKP